MKKNTKKSDLIQKIDKFNSICKDRKANVNEPHLARICHDNAIIRFICEEPIKLCNFDTDEDYIDYASCNAGEINDKKFLEEFEKLDLNCKKDVYSFIDSIESFLDWDDIKRELLTSKKILEDNNYSAFTYTQIPDVVLGAMQHDMTIEEFIKRYSQEEEIEKANRIINVKQVWKSDYDDYRANVEIGEGENIKGTIVASYDEEIIRDLLDITDKPLNEKSLKNAFACLVDSDFESYLELPKISDCSKLLQEIYDNVCESDATMCHISDEDWNDYYRDNYSDSDIEILKEEIKKYGLNEVIGIGDDGYKIVGYGDLETRFNDDRKLELSNESEIAM